MKTNKEEIEKELKKNLNELADIENTPETLKKIRETIQNVLDSFIFKGELYYQQFPIELQNEVFSLKIEANGNAYIIPKKAIEFVDLNFSISKTPPTNNLDLQYQNLVRDILENGTEKETRNGSVLSVFGRQIRHEMSSGFPLLTTKKMAWKQVVIELLWFLRGETNIKYLIENGCHIWTGDAYKKYETLMQDSKWRYENRLNLNWFTIDEESENFTMSGPIYRHLNIKEFSDRILRDSEFSNKWAELGNVYGAQWRWWKNTNNGEAIDQIKNAINELKNNPDSRRILVNAWNVSDIEEMTLPPCHYSFQFYTKKVKGKTKRELSLMFNMRSVDVPLGLPFNIASYALLLEIISQIVGMTPGELIANLGDTHIYSNQIDKIKTQLEREPYTLPILSINKNLLNKDIDDVLSEVNINDFVIENYTHHEAIKIPLSN